MIDSAIPVKASEGSVTATKTRLSLQSIQLFECHASTDIGECDVLTVVGTGAPASWRFNKFLIPRQLMLEHNMRCEYCYVSGGLDAWERMLKRVKPRVVLMRALIVDEYFAEILAVRFPHITFVHVHHSSFAFGTTEPVSFFRASRIIHLTPKYDNIIYAHPNEREIIAFRRIYRGQRFQIIWLPNVVQFSDLQKRQYDIRRTNVYLACVWRPLKNMMGQIFAVAAASRKKPIRFYLSIPEVGVSGVIKELLDTANAIPDFAVNIVDWKVDLIDYLGWMAHNVDVAMQVSFTESFNYVAWEAMELGIPTVTSHAIEFGVPGLIANADSIEEMSNCIITAINHYGAFSAQAKSVARDFGGELNKQYVNQMLELLGRS